MSTEYYKIMGGYQSDHDRNLTDPHTLWVKTTPCDYTVCIYFAFFRHCCNIWNPCFILCTTMGWSHCILFAFRHKNIMAVHCNRWNNCKQLGLQLVMLIDMVNNMVILINIVHYKWAGIQKKSSQMWKLIHVLQLNPMRFEPLDMTWYILSWYVKRIDLEFQIIIFLF